MAWVIVVLLCTSFYQPTEAGKCKKALKLVGLGASIWVAFTTAHRIGLEGYAFVLGKNHVGQGIFVKQSDFDQFLSSSQLRDPERHQKNIAKKITSLFDEDYQSSAKEKLVWATPRDAMTFVDGRSDKAGVCRHKACVIAGILRGYGIRAHIIHVASVPFYSEGQGHAFIYLPDIDAAFDPVVGIYGKSLEEALDNEYYKDKVAYNGTRNPLGFINWTIDSIVR